jgi:serine/threonine-protein kinase
MEPTKRIGDYEIIEELGRGGMGRVYKVRNIISDRIEAMKVLLPDLVGRQDLAARFVREIKTLATLHHPNIAALRTALSADNQLVMIMEFVEGESLAHRLVRGGAIPRPDATAYIDQVLDALSYAHTLGVVHRDIKPANMMLTPGGVVKLTDFGIARSRNDQTLTIAGTTTGSLSYMSPEQVNGEDTDARSDLYSVGISLYEMVTGQRPFRADSDFAVMVAHLKEMPRPPIELQPGLGPELNAIIMKSIAKDAKDRFQTAAEFRNALATLGRPSGVATQVIGVPGGAAVNFVPGKSTTIAPAVPPQATVPPIPAPMSPSGGGMAVAAAAPKQGHPAMYVALGGVLMIGTIVAAGLYIGQADAQPKAAQDAIVAPAAAPATTAIPVQPESAAPTAVPSEAAVPTPPATPTSTEPAASTPVATAAASATSPAVSAPAAAATASAPPTAATSAPPTSAAAPAASAMASRPAGSTSSGATSTATTGTRATAPRVAATPPPAPPAAPRRPAARESEAAAVTRPPTPPAAAQAADFDEMETEVDQLINRAAAVEQSLNVMQQQQARQGLSMRGDIVARQNSMKSNLTRAQQAVGQRDAARARRFIELAEGDVSALEKFLGR